MAINYPIIKQQTAGAAQSSGPGYFNYAVGTFSMTAEIVTGSAYTASVSASAYLFSVSNDVASGSTIEIAMPTSSLIQAGSGSVSFYAPAIEFWRLDTNPVTVKLVGDNGVNVAFGKAGASASYYEIPTSSYNNLVHLNVGYILYIPLELSSI
jgi:hypothetical protein